jgi:hypothetical protein
MNAKKPRSFLRGFRLRGEDLNLRPSGYEQPETQRNGPKTASIVLIGGDDTHPRSAVIHGEAIGNIELGTINVPVEGDQREGSAPSGHDGVAAALAAALERASAAGQWSVVATLAAELGARRVKS